MASSVRGRNYMEHRGWGCSDFNLHLGYWSIVGVLLKPRVGCGYLYVPFGFHQGTRRRSGHHWWWKCVTIMQLKVNYGASNSDTRLAMFTLAVGWSMETCTIVVI